MSSQLEPKVNGSNLESSSLSAKMLERRILRDLLNCAVATIVFGAAAYLLSLQDAIADWTGHAEIKEIDFIAVTMIYAVWVIGIFTLRRVYDLRSLMGERAAIEKELSLSRTVGAVGRMARGVAHDFNNVLVVLKGSLHLTLADAKCSSSIREYLQPALQAIDNATRLAEQLMRMGKQKPDPVIDIDLNEVIPDFMKLLKNIAEKDSIDLQTVLTAGECRVRASRGHIEQVIMNLVTNACESMTDGGRLTVETRRSEMCSVTAHGGLKIPPGDYILITVSDTGPGFSDEIAAHLFEPYFTTKKTGTGLGLATVYMIVEENGGALDVNSVLGQGTSFTIYWPAKPATPNSE